MVANIPQCWTAWSVMPSLPPTPHTCVPGSMRHCVLILGELMYVPWWSHCSLWCNISFLFSSFFPSLAFPFLSFPCTCPSPSTSPKTLAISLENLQARDGGRFDSNGSRDLRFSGYVFKLKVFWWMGYGVWESAKTQFSSNPLSLAVVESRCLFL